MAIRRERGQAAVRAPQRIARPQVEAVDQLLDEQRAQVARFGGEEEGDDVLREDEGEGWSVGGARPCRRPNFSTPHKPLPPRPGSRGIQQVRVGWRARGASARAPRQHPPPPLSPTCSGAPSSGTASRSTNPSVRSAT